MLDKRTLDDVLEEVCGRLGITLLVYAAKIQKGEIIQGRICTAAEEGTVLELAKK